ncbi:hypothetical protein M0813_18353 [Anaeramoeba flamelloides]|uniref:Uncharacterized protein n=1 Tax=Anaeramoeba flamelloides TaxID=1746091 RepID=A0ABQ8YSX1_9EUKA|nr:hypothetical protein M0813_18353 [Anaeramoeba flamelloides]
MNCYTGFGGFHFICKEELNEIKILPQMISNKTQIPTKSIVILHNKQIIKSNFQNFSLTKNMDMNELFIFDLRRIKFETYAQYSSKIQRKEFLNNFQNLPKPISQNIKVSVLQHQQFAKKSSQYAKECYQIQNYCTKALNNLLSSVLFYYKNTFKNILFRLKHGKKIKNKLSRTIKFETRVIKNFINIHNLKNIKFWENEIQKSKKEILRISPEILIEFNTSISYVEENERTITKKVESKWANIKLNQQKILQYLSYMEQRKIQLFEMFFLRGNILLCSLFEMRELVKSSKKQKDILINNLGNVFNLSTLHHQEENQDINITDSTFKKELIQKQQEKILEIEKENLALKNQLKEQKNLCQQLSQELESKIPKFENNKSINSDCNTKNEKENEKGNGEINDNENESKSDNSSDINHKFIQPRENRLKIKNAKKLKLKNLQSESYKKLFFSLLNEIDPNMDIQDIKSQIQTNSFNLNPILTKLKEIK